MYYILLSIDLSFSNEVFFHQKVSDYLAFAGIILVTLLLKKTVAAWLTRISSSLAIKYSYMKHKDAIREMLFKPFERLLQIVLFFIATEQLSNILDGVVLKRMVMTKKDIKINLGDITDHIFLFLFIFFFAQLITRFIDFVYYVRMGKAVEEKNIYREQMLPLIKEMSKLLTWILAGFWVLGSVLHVNVPALITGLGIGGVAIALAGKETVENFFAAFTILSDKPFQAGDSIKLGEIEAIVERIGFRSTRLRNADGSAYIIPNQNLVSQNLINLSTRSIRGMKFIANIRYGVSHEVLNQLIEEIKETLLKTPPVTEPVTAILELFEKETFQLVISYQLPHPLPEGETLVQIKHRINLMVFEMISRHAKIGALPGTS
jgi:MscS family membrane protein